MGLPNVWDFTLSLLWLLNGNFAFEIPSNNPLAKFQQPGIFSENAGCHFPESIQGLYKRQDDSKPPEFSESGQRYPVQYLEYYVGPTSIPHWGDCFERMDNTYVLGVKKVGGFMCFRCFSLVQRSPNVLQALTQAEDQCYQTIEAAKISCLDPHSVSSGDGIILWNTWYAYVKKNWCNNDTVPAAPSALGAAEAEDISYQYCPVAGRAQLSFMAAGGRLHCPYPSRVPSRISNCELGFQMDITFRGCTFPNQDMKLRCLGTWDAGKGNGETYFAVYNSQVEEYRCGLYRDDRASRGFAVGALSNDSTCNHVLFNSTDGFEEFVFYDESQEEWPEIGTECTFPAWLQGDWELLTVRPDMISYYHHNDPATMMTQYGKCVAIQGDKIRLYSRNHCGDPVGYHCLWVERRSESVIEFKMGNVVLQHDDKLFCNDPQIYANSSWNTLAVRQPTEVVPCAHPGHFVTPLALQSPANYCFNVTTDCTTQYHMKTVGYICNTDTVFETRQYQCIASWKENGTLFSYARRMDDDTKGCFASKIINGRVYMIWSGSQCDREIDFHQINQHQDSEKTLFVLQQTDFCPGQAVQPVSPDSFRPRPVKPTKFDTFEDTGRSFRKYPRNSGSRRSTEKLGLFIVVAFVFYCIARF